MYAVLVLLDSLSGQVVYLFLVCYGRQKADQLHLVIPSFLQVCPLRVWRASWNC